MPPAWQSRNGPYYDGQRPDVPERSLLDQALDPVRFITATTPRKVGVGLAILVWVLLIAF